VFLANYFFIGCLKYFAYTGSKFWKFKSLSGSKLKNFQTFIFEPYKNKDFGEKILLS
jgi:hypothetical protein